MALAAAAEQTIDAQHYLLHNDPTGKIFAWSVLQAADRGVRVRLLLDDMDTKSYDAVTAALDPHENVEIRLFNPFWRDQSLVAASLTDLKRINRRMHNKSMTADDAMLIVGGRASLQCLRAVVGEPEGFSLDNARDRLDEIIGDARETAGESTSIDGPSGYGGSIRFSDEWASA